MLSSSQMAMERSMTEQPLAIIQIRVWSSESQTLALAIMQLMQLPISAGRHCKQACSNTHA